MPWENADDARKKEGERIANIIYTGVVEKLSSCHFWTMNQHGYCQRLKTKDWTCLSCVRERIKEIFRREYGKEVELCRKNT